MTINPKISVTDFDGSDVTFGGTAAPGATGTVTETAPNDGTTYSLGVSGMTADGPLTATIEAGKVHDVAGNGNTASTSTDNTVTYVGVDLQSSFVVTSTADTDDGACTPARCCQKAGRDQEQKVIAKIVAVNRR